MRKPIYKIDKFTDLKDMLKNTEEKFSDRPAYLFTLKQSINSDTSSFPFKYEAISCCSNLYAFIIYITFI